jgi:hypothetical protein
MSTLGGGGVVLSGSVPWHRSLPGANLAHNLIVPGYELNEINGHMVKVIGPIVNDAWIDLAPIVTGAGVLWSFIVFVQGCPQLRHSGKAFATPAKAAEAAEAYAKERGLL